MDKKYDLHPKVEQAVVGSLIESDLFWNKLGDDMDLAKLPSPEAKAIAGATKKLKQEYGKAPGVDAVLGKLYDAFQKSEITLTALNTLEKYITESADRFHQDKEYDVNILVAEVAKVVRQVERVGVAEKAFEELASHGDMSTIAEDITKINAIGNKSGTKSFSLDNILDDTAPWVDDAADVVPLGIPTWDTPTGGVPRGRYLIWLGDTKGGKSMCLTQNAVQVVDSGLNAAVASLEVPAPTWTNRLLGGLTGIPHKEWKNNRKKHKPALAKIAQSRAQSGRPLGKFEVKRFGEDGADVILEDIFAWVQELEDSGFKVDALIIDYVDLLELIRNNPRKNAYSDQKSINQRLNAWSDKEGKWVFTASQTTRGATKKKEGKTNLPEKEDAADSFAKVRAADLVFGLAHDEAEKQVRNNVLADRHGDFADLPKSTMWTGHAFDYGVFLPSGSPVLSTVAALTKDDPGDLL